MSQDPLRDLARARWKVAIVLTVAIVAKYFGFIGLIAWQRPLLATLVVPGLSIGVLLGVVVIVASWLLTWVYVRWANRHYDPALVTVPLAFLAGIVVSLLAPEPRVARRYAEFERRMVLG